MSAAERSTDADALLRRTQRQIERLYGIEAPHSAEAFLLADPHLARILQGDGWTDTDESLLVREEEGDLELSLFLDGALLERLVRVSPYDELGHHNLADFWSLVEGVSHFVYLTWNAARRRSVTPLEMELQGEVDKFTLTALTWQRQRGGSPRALHGLLFDATRIDTQLSEDLRERYHDANRYAGRYCLDLQRDYLERRRPGLIDELRSFYREGRGGKLARIGQP
ncbi:MAG: hypothetical protein WD081_03370 [Gammaproteobacteria bacterium]